MDRKRTKRSGCRCNPAPRPAGRRRRSLPPLRQPIRCTRRAPLSRGSTQRSQRASRTQGVIQLPRAAEPGPPRLHRRGRAKIRALLAGALPRYWRDAGTIFRRCSAMHARLEDDVSAGRRLFPSATPNLRRAVRGPPRRRPCWLRVPPSAASPTDSAEGTSPVEVMHVVRHGFEADCWRRSGLGLDAPGIDRNRARAHDVNGRKKLLGLSNVGEA